MRNTFRLNSIGDIKTHQNFYRNYFILSFNNRTFVKCCLQDKDSVIKACFYELLVWFSVEYSFKINLTGCCQRGVCDPALHTNTSEDHSLWSSPYMDVVLGEGTDRCVYNIPMFPYNISLGPVGTRWKALWPNITVTAGVEAPISPVSLMFTDVWRGGADNSETSARLDKHLTIQSNSTPSR